MKYLTKIRENLFYLFLIILPFGIRHIFNFAQIQNTEGFRENLSWSLYGLDILFALLLMVSLLQYFLAKGKTLNKTSILIYAFLGWILLASFFASNGSAAFYGAARITEAVLFFLVAKNLLSSREVLQKSALVIFAGGILQSILAFFQFIFQKSIGLKLLGESVISPQILGVSKVEIGGTILQNIFHGEKIIRAYGTFPHPNLLGAFLLLSLICGFFLTRSSCRNRHSVSSKTDTKCLLGLGIILLGILLTFSRSIWLITTILVALTFYQCKKNKFIQNSKTLNSHSKFQILNSKFFLLTASIMILAAIFIISPRLCLTNCQNDQSFTLRQIYNKIALQTIKKHPIWGVGTGNFILAESEWRSDFHNGGRTSTQPFELRPWEIQPVHNLYLLIASETGLIGLMLFLVILFENLKLKIKNYRKNELDLFFTVFILFLLLSFIDHYFWTLPQGQFVFWLSLAFLTAWGRINKELKETA